MTSHQFSANKSAAKYDFKTALKGIIVPSAAAFLGSVYVFVYMPLLELIDYVGVTGINFTQLRKDIALLLVYDYPGMYYADFGIGIGCLYIFLGAVFALFSFSFIMKKKKVNVFLSSGVDRRTLYKNRTLASIMLLAAAITVPLAADFAINVYFFGHFSYVLGCALLLFAECLIYAITGFAVMAVAMAFCSTVVESIFFSGTLLAAPTAVVYFIDSLCSAFLRGYNYNSVSFYSYDYYTIFENPSLLHYTSIINPLILGKAYGAKHSISENMIKYKNSGYVTKLIPAAEIPAWVLTKSA